MTANLVPSQRGRSHPIGATLRDGGVGFSVYARRATGIDLLLFGAPDAAAPDRVIPLDPHEDRTADYWHVFVPGLGPGQPYGFRAHGPFEPERGLRFDPGRLLLDPYGRGVAIPAAYRRDPAAADLGAAMKSVVVDLDAYDWEGDRPLHRPFFETIIYEAHVRGFTAHPGSGLPAELRGTYAGMIQRIPYLLDLGITAVELMPVFQFDVLAAPAGRRNYWGYQPVAFFAAHDGYAMARGAQGVADEFRDLVRALHRAGIEVILDVVYNHTAEAGADGPTFSFRGLANDEYYILDADRSRYADYTGCGNTFNANQSIVRRLILDSLRFWVTEMHVDGFRFDLASVLSRDEQGQPMAEPPIVWDINTDPVLAGTKLIAEAWDAAGLYQVGSFLGDQWKEWNGRFRDDVRRFVRSEPGRVWAVAQRFLASPDIYGHEDRPPQESINFVTAHDGFTLEDLVSYDSKHNEANGEGNRDGSDQNLSWNCGVEGPTDDPQVEALRRRQIRNFLTIELLALGVPMLLMGDEVRRTQRGNNNAYVADDETSWFDWEGVTRHAGLLRFTQCLIRARRRLQTVLGAQHDMPLLELLETAHIEWSGVRLGQPDLGAESRSLALTVWGRHAVLHIVLNAWWEALDFELPPVGLELEGWRRVIDTTLESPDDFVEYTSAPSAQDRYRVGGRSVVVLVSPRVSAGPRGEPIPGDATRPESVASSDA